ncbi:hypothetical protein LTR37_019358 [Vermiconidia calcicola]|uniref:Uncharacterized protein n=1 Tax=Vermiconidia calcicola TaxID=1690605 RepID=A0ACC3MFK9_9PEZI|nr:hypothetical protein LTR37_019358 [Vermiconidia calcicola]
MDWTGGTRRRFAAGKNNSTLQKQKQHFAKARAVLQTTPGSLHGFRPSFLRPTPSPTNSVSGQQLPHVDLTSRQHKLVSSGLGQRERQPERQHFSNQQDEHRQNDSQLPRTRKSLRSSHPAGLSSSDHSCRVGSSTSHVNTSRSKHASRRGSRANKSSQEEKLLLANQQRLLARRDWLGLAPTRPVQMNFLGSHDKEHIGKRRKIEKSGPRTSKPAGRRLVTPLFEQRLAPEDYTTNGGIQLNEVLVKIGTDALVSQTQRTNRSQTPGQVSVRQPSTEFGPLSEEPMLLGADGDSFEALGSTEVPSYAGDVVVPESEAALGLAGSQPIHDIQHVPESAKMHAAVDWYELYLTSPSSGDHANSAHSAFLSDRIPNSQGHGLCAQNLHHDGEGVEVVAASFMQPPYDSRVDVGTTQSQSDDNDRIWRKFMNIRQNTSSHVSMAALKSSSLHLTTSDSSHRPKPNVEDDLGYESQAQPSAPKGAGTQTSKFRHGQELVDGMSLSSPANSVQSRSASLKQITKLAEQPTLQYLQDQEQRDDDALWRSFIIRSQDESDDSPRYLGGDLERGQEDVEAAPQTAFGSPSAAVSGLVKSLEGSQR